MECDAATISFLPSQQRGGRLAVRLALSAAAGRGRDRRDRPAGHGEQLLIIEIEPESCGFVDDASGFLEM